MIITTLITLSVLSFIGFQATLVASIIRDHQAEKIFHDTVNESKRLNVSKHSVISMIFQKTSAKRRDF